MKASYISPIEPKFILGPLRKSLNKSVVHGDNLGV